MPKYPEIGDQVWWYFLHALTDLKLPPDNPLGGGLWRATGKYEMRCRPALVTGLHADEPEWMYPDLRVEFSSDDMQPAYSGLACRLESVIRRARPHLDSLTPRKDSYELCGRIVGGRWPHRGCWAWDPMPGFEGGR